MILDISNDSFPNAKALIDDEDYDRVKGFRWHVNKSVRGLRYYTVQAWTGERTELLHRVVMRATIGEFVDIINGNGFDCRKENLRFATRSQYHAHRRKFRKSSSAYLGVHWDKSLRRWRAGIRVNGKRTQSPGFTYETDAARWYDDMARKHNGEFAMLNLKNETT